MFTCSLDGAGFTPCASPTSYSSLSDGTHTFRVAAQDRAGNVDPTPANRTWTVDAQGPIIVIQRPTGGLYVNDQSEGGVGPIVVVGHVTVQARPHDLESGVASLRFEVNGSPIDPSQVSVQDGVYSFSFHPGSAGEHTIVVNATNGSGVGSISTIRLYGIPT
jgi:hypothetical protein